MTHQPGTDTLDDLARFRGQNPDCPDPGRRDVGNLTVCDRDGPHRQDRLLDRRTGKARFSARKGTPRYRSHRTEEKALSVLSTWRGQCGKFITGRR